MIRHSVRFTRAVAFALAASMIPFFPVHAQVQSNLVVVLDGSGSMWGRIQGDRMKIVEAKQVTRELLQDVPASVNLGFVAYGHRRKGDCADIETIAPLGTAPAAIAAAVDGITPQGKTPITDSLRHSANLLGDSDNPSTIVLVSDGIETCQGDPCALAGELKAGGIDLIIHTVGFGVDDAAAQQLRCVAEAGGGNYYHVTDGSQLRDALFAVREAVARQESPAPPPPPPEPEVSSTTVMQIGPATLVLRPASWVAMPVHYWKVVEVETGEDQGQSRDERMRVRAGEYQIAWRQSQLGHDEVLLSEVVDAAAGETVEVPIDTGVRPVLPEGFETPYQWSLRIPGQEDAVATYKRVAGPQVSPAGRYELVWHQSQLGSRPVNLGIIEIEQGILNDIMLGGLQVTPTEWVPGEPYAYRLIDEDDEIIGSWKLFGRQFAPAGTYRFDYQQSQLGHSTCAWGEVTVPEDGFVSVPINSGVRFRVSDDTPLPYRVFFVDLDTQAECIWNAYTRNDWEAIPLPPGRYRLDWQEPRPSQRITLLDEFEVPPATLVEFQM